MTTGTVNGLPGTFNTIALASGGTANKASATNVAANGSGGTLLKLNTTVTEGIVTSVSLESGTNSVDKTAVTSGTTTNVTGSGTGLKATTTVTAGVVTAVSISSGGTANKASATNVAVDGSGGTGLKLNTTVVEGKAATLQIHSAGTSWHANKQGTAVATVATTGTGSGLTVNTIGIQNKITGATLYQSRTIGDVLTDNGTIASVASTSHGLVTNDIITVENAINSANNGVKTVTRVDDNSFTFPSGGAETTHVRWASTNVTGAIAFPHSGAGRITVEPVTQRNRVAELTIGGANTAVQARKNLGTPITGLTYTAGGGSGLSITPSGTLGIISAIGAIIGGSTANALKGANGVFPETSGSGSGAKINCTGDLGKVSAIAVTVAGTAYDPNKSKNAAAYTRSGSGSAALVINTTGVLGVVTGLALTAAGTAESTNKDSSTALVQGAGFTYTKSAGNAHGVGGAGGTGLTFTTSGARGSVATFAAGVTGANTAVNSLKNSSNVFPETSGAGSGLKIKTTGTMGKVTGLAVTAAGTASSVNKNKNTAAYTGGTGSGLVINTTGRRGMVTGLEVTSGANVAVSAHKNKDGATYTAYSGPSGSGLAINTTGTLGALKTVALANEGTTVVTNQSAYAVGGGTGGTIKYDRIAGVVTAVAINSGAASRGLHASTPGTADTETQAITGAGTGFILNACTWRTGVALTSTLLAPGEDYAVVANNATTTVTGGGTGAVVNVSAIRTGVPKNVSYANDTARGVALSLSISASVAASATSTTITHGAATLYVGQTVAVSGHAAVGGDGGANVAMNQTFTVTTVTNNTTATLTGSGMTAGTYNTGTIVGLVSVASGTGVATQGGAGTGAKANVTVASGIPTGLTNSALSSATLSDFPASTASRATVRADGITAGPNVAYQVTICEVTTATAIPTHAGQDTLGTGAGKNASRVFRATTAGGGYTDGQEITLTSGGNTIRVFAIGAGALTQFKIKEGHNAAAGVYTDSGAGIAAITVFDCTQGGASTFSTTAAPAFTVAATDGVVTAVTLTSAGSDYVSSSSNASEYATLGAGSGTGATFGIDGFLAISNVTYDAAGTFQIEANITNLPTNRDTALTAGQYTVYQAQPGTTSRSAYANTTGKGYNGFAVDSQRRMIYIDGNTPRNQASGAIIVPATGSGAPWEYSSAGAGLSASPTIQVGTVSDNGAFTTLTASVVNDVVWENTTAASAAASTYLTITPSTAGNVLSFTLQHKNQPIHDVAALKFTVLLEQTGDSMHGATKTIVDAFDVFLHTLNDPFLRIDKVLGTTYGQTVPANNVLSRTLWDDSTAGTQYTTAKGTRFAEFEFEAGSGDYRAAMSSDCFFVSSVDNVTKYVEFTLNDPNHTSRRLRDNNGNLLTVERAMATHLRRLAREASSLTMNIGGNNVSVVTGLNADVSRTGGLGGASTTTGVGSVASNGNYRTVTTVANHNLLAGDTAYFVNGGVTIRVPVIYSNNATVIGVYSTATPAGSTLYTDRTVLRIKCSGALGGVVAKQRLNLALSNNGSALDARLFRAVGTDAAGTITETNTSFTVRANDAAWRTATNCAHAENVRMLDWQADDLVSIGTVVQSAAAGATQAVTGVLHSMAVGEIVQLTSTQAGTSATETRVTAASSTSFDFTVPTGWNATATITVKAKGVSYAVSNRLLDMRLATPPTLVGRTEIDSVYATDTGVVVSTEIFDLKSRGSRHHNSATVTAAMWNDWAASTVALQGPVGPVREGAMSAYDITYTDNHANLTGAASTDADMESAACTVAYSSASASAMTYTATAAFALDTESGARVVDNARNFTTSSSTVTPITVAQVTNKTQAHVDSDNKTVHAWETVLANQELLTFGKVATTTRSQLNFAGASALLDTLRRTVLVCNNVTVAAAVGNKIQQLDANGHVVAEGTVTNRTATATRLVLEFKRDWGADFTATAATRVVNATGVLQANSPAAGFTPGGSPTISTSVSFAGDTSISITQSVAASATSTTITHGAATLTAGDKLVVSGHTAVGGDGGANLAMNQTFTVASITNATTAVLTGSGMTAGTYNTGTIVGRTKDTTNSHKLTTGTSGFNYLDYDQGAADTQTRGFGMEIRGIEADSHAIDAQNKRVVTKVATDLSIVHCGSGYVVGNTITLTLPGGATADIEVKEVNLLGGVERFRLKANSATKASNSTTLQVSAAGGGGSGFRAKISSTDALHTKYYMNTHGFTNSVTGGSRDFNLDLYDGANTTQYSDITKDAAGYVKETGQADLYLKVRDTGAALSTPLDLRKASVQAVQGYDYPAVRYMPGEATATPALKTYRSPRFELMDHGTTNALNADEGALATDESSVSLGFVRRKATGNGTTTVAVNSTGLVVGMSITGTGVPANTTVSAVPGGGATVTASAAVAAGTVLLSFHYGGSNYSPLDVLSAGGMKILVREVKAADVPQAATTANGNAAVTLGAANANIFVGASVSGTGIAAGTTVAAVSGTSLTLSQAATASGAATLTFGPYNTAPAAKGAVTRFEILSGTAANNTTHASTGGTGTGAKFVVSGTSFTGLNNKPVRSLHLNSGTVDAELAAVASSSSALRTNTGAGAAGPAADFSYPTGLAGTNATAKAAYEKINLTAGGSAGTGDLSVTRTNALANSQTAAKILGSSATDAAAITCTRTVTRTTAANVACATSGTTALTTDDRSLASQQNSTSSVSVLNNFTCTNTASAGLVYKLDVTTASFNINISQSVASSATSTVITHAAATLAVNDKITVSGHSGSAANLAMNQTFTIAAITNNTTATLTGFGMTAGTYNTGTIVGAVAATLAAAEASAATNAPASVPMYMASTATPPTADRAGPLFTTQPAATLNLGAALTTTVATNVGMGAGLGSGGNVAYQWYQNGALSAGNTSATLTLTDVPTKAGFWYCKATDANGSTFSNTCRVTSSAAGANPKINAPRNANNHQLANWDGNATKIELDYSAGMDYLQPYGTTRKYTTNVVSRRHGKLRTSLPSADAFGAGEFGAGIATLVHLQAGTASDDITVTRHRTVGQRKTSTGFNTGTYGPSTHAKSRNTAVVPFIRDIVGGGTAAATDIFKFTPTTGLNFGRASTAEYNAQFDVGAFERDLPFTVAYATGTRTLTVTPVGLFKRLLDDHNTAAHGNHSIEITTMRSKPNGDSAAAVTLFPSQALAAGLSGAQSLQLSLANQAIFEKERLADQGLATNIGSAISLVDGGQNYAKNDTVQITDGSTNSGYQITVTRVHPETGAILNYTTAANWAVAEGFTAGAKATTSLTLSNALVVGTTYTIVTPGGLNWTTVGATNNLANTTFVATGNLGAGGNARAGAGALFRIEPRSHLNTHTVTIALGSGASQVKRTVVFRYARADTVNGAAQAQFIEYISTSNPGLSDVDKFLNRPTNAVLTPVTSTSKNYLGSATSYSTTGFSIASGANDTGLHLSAVTNSNELVIGTTYTIVTPGGLTWTAVGAINSLAGTTFVATFNSLASGGTASSGPANYTYKHHASTPASTVDLSPAHAVSQYSSTPLTDLNGTASAYTNTARIKVTVGTDVTLKFDHAGGSTSNTGDVDTGDADRKQAALDDTAKRAHLVYAKTVGLANGAAFANFTTTGNGGAPDVVFNTTELTQTLAVSGGNKLAFATVPSMAESVGRTPVLLARTEPTYDGPGGSARARDALYLSIYDALTVSTLNHRWTPAVTKTAGTNYAVGNTLTGTGEDNFTLTVAEVDTSGGIQRVTVTNAGTTVTTGLKTGLTTAAGTAAANNGTGAEIQVDAVYGGSLIIDHVDDSKFTGISHTKTRVLDDAVSATLHPFAITSQNSVFTEGNNAGKPQSDLFLSVNAASGFKALGWVDSLPGRPTLSTSNTHKIAMTGSDAELTVAFSGGSTTDASNANDLATTTSITGNTLADQTALSRSGEGAFWVQQGRRLTGRAGVDHATAAFAAEANTKRTGLQPVHEITTARVQIGAGAGAGTGYAVNDLLKWEGTILKVTAITGGGATGPVGTVTVQRAGVYVDVKAYSAASGGTGTGATFRLNPAAGVTSSNAELVKLPGIGFKTGTSPTTLTLTKATATKSLTVQSHSSKLLSTDSSFQTHTSSATALTFDRVPNIATGSSSVSLKIADTGGATLSALTLSSGSYTDSTARKYAKYQKLWSADGSVFTGGFYVNGNWAKNGSTFAVTETSDTCPNLLRAKGVTVATGLTVNSLRANGISHTRAFGLVAGPGAGKLTKVAGGTATVTTAAAHRLATNDLVVIKCTASTGHHGIFKVTVTNATQFTYTSTAANVTNVVVDVRSQYPFVNTTASNALITGTTYTIVAPGGLTTWTTIGAADNNTGTTFVATGSIAAGGTAHANKNSARIDLVPNGYSANDVTLLKLSQSGTSVLATQLAVAKSVANATGRGLDLTDQPTDTAEDLAFIHKGGTNWELAVTDALLSTATTGRDAPSHAFESYKALTLDEANRGDTYQVGDVLTVTGGDENARVQVTATSGDTAAGGPVASFKLTAAGTGYTTSLSAASTGGGNNLAKFVINRVTAAGGLLREFETEYRSASESNMAAGDTNDGGGSHNTIAAEKWTVSNAGGLTTAIASSAVPSILTDAGTYSSGAASRSWKVRSGSDASLLTTTLRSANAVTATVSGFTRPMIRSGTTYNQKRSTSEDSEVYLIPGTGKAVNEVRWDSGGSASTTTSAVLSLPEAARPRYSVMRKPELTSASAVTKQGIALASQTIDTDLATFTTTNCDQMLIFTNRNDVGGSSANDRATAFEDRAAISVDFSGTTSAYSEGTASSNQFRRFDAVVSSDAETDQTATVALSVTTKGNARFFKLDKTSIRYDAVASVAIASQVATVTWAVTQSATTVNTNTAVTLAAANANIAVNAVVSGTGIQAGTTVAAVSGTSLTLSKAANASATNTLTFGHGLDRDEQVGDYANVQFAAGATQTSGSKAIASISTDGLTFTYATTDANATVNAEVSLGQADETAREITVVGAASGSLTSSSALTKSSGTGHNAHVYRLQLGAQNQPMDVSTINGTITADSVTGGHGDGQSSANRRFPAASGILGQAITNLTKCKVVDVDGQTYTNGTLAIVTFDGAATGVSVVVADGSATGGTLTGSPNAIFVVGINYRLGTATGPLVDVDALVTATLGMPQNANQISLISGGSGYATGDVLFVNNATTAGIGRDRIKVTVTTVTVPAGVITAWSGSYPGTAGYTHPDGTTDANEPVYVLDANLTTSTAVGAGTGATFKFASTPAFQISARKQHPFYIYSANNNKINLTILLSLSLTTTDMASTSNTRNAYWINSVADGIYRLPAGTGPGSVLASVPLAKTATTLYTQSAGAASANSLSTGAVYYLEDNLRFTVYDASIFTVGQRVIVGSGATAETMVVTAKYAPYDIGVQRGPDAEDQVSAGGRTIAQIHYAGDAITLDSSQFYTQGEGRVRYTEPIVTNTTLEPNKMLVEPVTSSTATGDIGDLYYVYALSALRATFRSEWSTAFGASMAGTSVSHVVWNTDVSAKSSSNWVGNEWRPAQGSKSATLPTVMGLCKAFLGGQTTFGPSGGNALSISQSVAASATSTTITHAAYTLTVGQLVVVTGHTGNAANLAMNQTFTVASVTSSTIAVLTGSGMTAGTYNTGTIVGRTGLGATYDRYTVQLLTTTGGTIPTTSGTRGTLILAQNTDLTTHTISKPSKLQHFTPMSREVHLSGIQLVTASKCVFGDVDVTLSITQSVASSATSTTITHGAATLTAGDKITVSGHTAVVDDGGANLAMNQTFTVASITNATTAVLTGTGMTPGTYNTGTIKGNTNYDNTEPDDLSNDYPSNRFDIFSYLVRRTNVLPQASAGGIVWKRNTTTQAVTVDITLVAGNIAGSPLTPNDTNIAVEHTHVFSASGKSSANTEHDVVLVQKGVVDATPPIYLIVFGNDQKLSGYYTLGIAVGSLADNVGAAATTAVYKDNGNDTWTLRFNALDASWTTARKQFVDVGAVASGGVVTVTTGTAQSVLIMRAENTGRDWTYPDTGPNNIKRQRSLQYGNSLSITQSVAASATSTTITHDGGTTLAVNQLVAVAGHTGNAANLAMNQTFTVASVTSSTIAVLTGSGMTAGTYNTGAIVGASAITARANTATLFTGAQSMQNPTFLGSATVAADADMDATSFGDSHGGGTNRSTLVNRKNMEVLHSNGVEFNGLGLGTINMMTDERRMYRIFSKTNLSRFTTDRFKLVDLPTRIDMRDVIVTVVRPRPVTYTSSDQFDRGDIIVMGQCADLSHLVGTSKNTTPTLGVNVPDGDFVRFLHPFVSASSEPPRPEMAMSKRDGANSLKDNSTTIDGLLRMKDRSLPVGLHPHAYEVNNRNINYTMRCSAKLGQGTATQPGLSSVTIDTTASPTLAAGVTQITINWTTEASEYRKSELKEGDRVILSTLDHVAPDGMKTRIRVKDTPVSTQVRIEGVLKADATETSVGGSATTVSMVVTLDSGLSAAAFAARTSNFYLTPAARVRRILSSNKAYAIRTPGWGFRNDAQHGPDAPANSRSKKVREGSYLAGLDDSDMRLQLFELTTNTQDIKIPTHYDSTTATTTNSRLHPFSVHNVTNMIPTYDVFKH